MKRPIEANYFSYVAYTRALEDYCDSLEQPKQEPTVSKGAYNRLRNDYNDLVSKSEQDVKDAKEWRAHVNRCKLLGVGLDYQTTSPQPPQRKPLPEDQLMGIWKKAITQDNGRGSHLSNQPFVHIARAIEAAHNIKKAP